MRDETPFVEAIRGSLETENLTHPGFWSVVAQTELQLYQAFALSKVSIRRKDLERVSGSLRPRTRALYVVLGV